MIHVMLSESWRYSEEPFPAFRADLVFGRNKRDRAFLPTKVTPVPHYGVSRFCDYAYPAPSELTADRYQAEAEVERLLAADAKYQEYLARVAAADGAWVQSQCAPAKLHESVPLLPRDQFRVIKTREKGTILVVPGEDRTPRALAFLSIRGGFRGGCGPHSGDTTAQILVSACAGNACDSEYAAVALFDVGQSVAMRSYGRRTNLIRVYTWDGRQMQSQSYDWEEYQARNLDPEGEAL